MKTTLFILFAGAVLLSVASGIAAAAGTQEMRSYQATQFAWLIDKIIFTCAQKNALIRSESDTVSEDAALSLMKADFFRKNRDLLIEDMMNAAVAPKSHTVQHFMNQRFFAIIRDGDPTIVEAYSPPDEIVLPVSNQ